MFRYLDIQVMMLTLVFLAFQGAGAVGSPADAAPAVIEEAAPESEPKIVCSMEPVTGTRARKQKICKPVGGFDPRAERSQDILRAIQGDGGNGQPKPPPTMLQGPG